MRKGVTTHMPSEQRFLYRGINAELYVQTSGGLAPKTHAPFQHIFQRDGTIRRDGSATRGRSEQNAVLYHELEQKGYPTTGISTTPFFERASVYAMGGGKYPKGYVVKIDRHLLSQFGVREYVIAEWIPHPSIPEDEEVILVAADYGVLPGEIVVDRVEVTT